MRDATVYSLGDPGTFDLVKSDPMYYTERLSHEISTILYNLNTGGFQFYQPENADYNDLETALTTWADDMHTWLGSAAAANEGELPIPLPPALPDLTTIIGIITGNPWLMFLLKGGFELLRWWLKKKFEHDTDMSEIVDMLRHCLTWVDTSDGDKEYTLAELTKYLSLYEDYDGDMYPTMSFKDSGGTPQKVFGIARLLRKLSVHRDTDGELRSNLMWKDEASGDWYGLAEILSKIGLDINPDDELYSLLYLLARGKLQITLTDQKTLDDVMFE